MIPNESLTFYSLVAHSYFRENSFVARSGWWQW